MASTPSVMTIAGSDPSSGAGIQADIRTLSYFGCHAYTAITAITSQNSTELSGVSPVSPSTLSDQIDSILSDFAVGAVKIGMVYDSDIIRTVRRKIGPLGVPVVTDPVVRSTTGGVLLQDGAVPDFREHIVPMSYVMTPNVSELGIISGIATDGMDGVPRAAAELQRIGAENIAVTGLEHGGVVSDRIFLADGEFVLGRKKIPAESHGGGCAYSAALAASLARGDNIRDAVRAAWEFAYESMSDARALGGGARIASHGPPALKAELERSIRTLCGLDGIWRHIPECQTNFVFAKPDPGSAADILGLDGRIVRAGRGAVVAGSVRPGGSRHVATAVLHVCRRFPGMRSAANIRFDPDTVRRIASAGMRAARYDRRSEPRGVKSGGSSIAWGIDSVVDGADRPYDAIYHEGDLGKEPMIMIFGTNPGDVVGKIRRILSA